MSDDRRQRDLELLRRSQQALQDEQDRLERGEQPEPSKDRRASSAPAADDGGGEVRMYRGKPIRGGGSGTPGAGSGSVKGSQFRGVSTERKKKAQPDFKQVLERLNELYKDGLISKTEYDRKRLQILDRI